MYCIVPVYILHDFFHDVDALTCNLTSQPASKQIDYLLLLLTMSDLLRSKASSWFWSGCVILQRDLKFC
jgi:hypothetical protein